MAGGDCTADPSPAVMAAVPGRPASAHRGWRLLVLTCGYLIVALLGLLLTEPPDYAAPVWPAAGLAFVAALFWGTTSLAGIWLGALMAVVVRQTLFVGVDLSLEVILLGCLLGLAAALQAWLGAWLARSLVRPGVGFSGFGQRLQVLSLIGPVACLISATCALVPLYLVLQPSLEHLSRQWIIWWAADSLGVILLGAPALLAYQQRSLSDSRAARILLATCVGVALLVSACYLAGATLLNDSQYRRQADWSSRVADLVAREVTLTLESSVHRLAAIALLIDNRGRLPESEFAHLAPLLDWAAAERLVWLPAAPTEEGVAVVGGAIVSTRPGTALTGPFEAGAETLRSALRRAADSREPQLWQRAGGASADTGLRLIYPVLAGAVAGLEPGWIAGSVMGYLVADYQAQRPFAAADTLQAAAGLRLLQRRAGAPQQVIYSQGSIPGRPGLARPLVLPLAGEVWLEIWFHDAPLSWFQVLIPAYPLLCVLLLLFATAACMRYAESGMGYLRAALRQSEEIRRSNLALRQKELELADFKAILECSADGVVIFEPQSLRITYVNQGAERQLGYNRDQLLGMTVPDIQPDYDADTLHQLLAPLVDGERATLALETRHRHRDGRDIPVGLMLQCANSHKQGRLLVATVRDITRQTLLEARVRASEERLRALLDSLPLMVAKVDLEGRLEEINSAFARLHGCPPGQLVGQSLDQVFFLSAAAVWRRDSLARHLPRLCQGRSIRFDLDWRADAGRARQVFDCLLAPLLDARGEVSSVVVSALDISARKHMELEVRQLNDGLEREVIRRTQALRASEQHNHTLIEYAPDALLLADDRGRIQRLNDRARVLFGAPAAQLQAEYLDDLVPGLSARIDRVQGQLAQVQSAAAALDLGDSLAARDVDGASIPVEINVRHLGLDGDEVMLVSLRDVRERKRLQESARRQQEILNSIMDHIPVMISYHSAGGELEWVNRHFERALGFSSEDMQRPATLRKLFPNTEELVRLRAFARQAGETWLECHPRARDGRERVNSWSYFPLPSGGGFGIGLDLTELRWLEEKYRKILETAPDAMLLTDEQGVIELVNRQAEQLFGYPREQLLGSRIDVLVPRLQRRDETPDYVRCAMGLTGELSGRRQDGAVFPLELSASPIDTAAQTLICYAVRDVSVQKSYQRQLSEAVQQQQLLSRRLVELQESERRALAGELHDQVGQNLTALSINLAIIARQASQTLAQPLRNRLQDCERLVEGTTEAIEMVLNDLRPPQIDVWGLQDVLAWYARQFSQRTEIGLQPDFSGAPRRLAAEAEINLFRMVQEVLTNVARHSGASEVKLTLHWRATSLLIEIVDNGCGFDVERSRRSGRMGMLILGERAEAIGCRLQLHSEPGVGTRVRLELNTTAATLADAESVTPAEAGNTE